MPEGLPELLDLAPYGAFGETDPARFDKLYVERLNRKGVDRIARQLSALLLDHPDGTIVLCCYEDLLKGERCHRQTFARWWLEQTGELITDLCGWSPLDPIPVHPPREEDQLMLDV